MPKIIQFHFTDYDQDFTVLYDDGTLWSRHSTGEWFKISLPVHFSPVADPAASQMDAIMQADKDLADKPIPVAYSWQDWRVEHPLVRVGRTGEDGDVDDWRKLWAIYGKEIFDVMYQRLTKKLEPGKSLWFNQVNQWLVANTKDT